MSVHSTCMIHFLARFSLKKRFKIFISLKQLKYKADVFIHSKKTISACSQINDNTLSL